MADFEIIDRHSELESLAQELLQEDVIAVDTEADSFYHYFDKTCLVQVATRKNSYLIDPLALGGPAELAPLAPVFASPDTQKIFHAAEYDIFVLKRDCGFRFANLYDTMVSAQLLGYPAIGLAALIEHHFGLKVPKDEQRSDWSRRPLSDKQLSYAAGDVLYLIRLASKLERALKHAGRFEWATEEFAAVTRREWPERSFDQQGYMRIKGAKKLADRELAVLRELYLMRDARAREIDRPTFKVLGNRTLLELSERQPRTNRELSDVKGVTDLIVHRMGRDILAAVKTGRSAPKSAPPAPTPNGRKRVDRRTERIVNRMKRWRATRAQELELDPGVLCPNSSLEAIAWKDPKTEEEIGEVTELKGWFVTEFASEVLGVVRRDDPPADDTTGTAKDSGNGRATQKSSRSASGKTDKTAEAPARKKRRRRKKKGPAKST